MKLSTKILIAMGLGLLTGILLTFLPETTVSFINTKVLEPVGRAFLNLIQLVVIPFILSSLIVGVASLGDTKKIRAYGLKSFGLYLITTSIALLLGILGAKLSVPGDGLNLIASKAIGVESTPSIIDTFISMIPRNPFEALSLGNTIQVIVFSILMGVGIASAGEKGKSVYDFFHSLNDVIYEVSNIIMKTTPIGVFALITTTVSSNGIDIFLPLAKYMIAMIIIILIQSFVVYPVFIRVVARLNPIHFFRSIILPLQIAFSTCTSITVLPITIKAMKESLGVSERVADFTVPFGMTVKKDGAAIFHSFTALFIAQAYGVTLSIPQMIMLSFIVLVVSFSSAGIPGGGIIMLSIVLSSVGLPLEGIALIAGIDRVTDMFRSAVNVLGVIACGTGLASIEGELDRETIVKNAVKAV